MDELEIKNLQTKIGYNFKNSALLSQAYIRDSFVKEDIHFHTSNQSLSWVGQRILAYVVDQRLISEYMKVNDQNELSFVKADYETVMEKEKILLSESFIAKQVAIYSLYDNALMGEKDKKRKANKMYSVRNEFLLAIIGAVAVDSNYNLFSLKQVVDLLIDLDYYIANGFNEPHYVALVNKWTSIGKVAAPRFVFNANTFSYGTNQVSCTCFVDSIKRSFTGKGNSKSEARMAAAKAAYEHLKASDALYTLKDEIAAPSKDNAINALQELSMKGYFTMPIYEVIMNKGENTTWTVTCKIEGKDFAFTNTAPLKKDAKKESAYQMLLEIIK